MDQYPLECLRYGHPAMAKFYFDVYQKKVVLTHSTHVFPGFVP